MSDKKQDSKKPRGKAKAEARKGAAARDGGGQTAQARPRGWQAGELEQLKAENAALKDKLLRTVAEMENLRKRTERDKADMARYAISSFARDVLTIGDNIRRAIDHVPADAAGKDPALKSFLDGVEVTERELLNMLERHGITRLEPKGERFDPNRHQAMMEVENKDVAEGTVVEVIQAGYIIADRVLRPALVAVAKGGPKPEKQEAPPPAPGAAANDDTPPGGPDGAPPESPQDKGPGGDGVGGHVDKSA